jgi:predicted transport protein
VGDIRLFSTTGPSAVELTGSSVQLEKSLQTYMEQNLEALLGVTFLATEYATGKTHGGRIDTLGLDENGFPVIIEYKRAMNENVINQGLYYLDWLLDHQAEFELLVLKRLGQEKSGGLDFSSPRLLCIAGDFTKYDIHAVSQINRNIELIRYRKFEAGLLLLDLVNVTTVQSIGTSSNGTTPAIQPASHKNSVARMIEQSDPVVHDRYETLKAFMEALGDDVTVSVLKSYVVFKRLRNFACVYILPTRGEIVIWVKIDPDNVKLEEGFTRDVRKIGHWGTGDLEITIKNDEDLEKAKPLILRSYDSV